MTTPKGHDPSAREQRLGERYPAAVDLDGVMAAPKGYDPSARGQRPGNWRPRHGLEPHRGVTRYRCQLFRPGFCVKGGRPFRLGNQVGAETQGVALGWRI